MSFNTHWTCGALITINHVAGAVAPVTKTTSYFTVTNIPGETAKCWIRKNLGASQATYSVNDPTEEAAGWYWQFNRKQGYKHDGVTRTPNTAWISSINESSSWQVANDPCTIELGGTWRIPTSTEWNNVDMSGNWFTWSGPGLSNLRLHAGGALNDSNGSLSDRGYTGAYWSTAQNSPTTGSSLYFTSVNCNMDTFNKAYGFTLRCIRD